MPPMPPMSLPCHYHALYPVNTNPLSFVGMPLLMLLTGQHPRHAPSRTLLAVQQRSLSLVDQAAPSLGVQWALQGLEGVRPASQTPAAVQTPSPALCISCIHNSNCRSDVLRSSYRSPTLLYSTYRTLMYCTPTEHAKHVFSNHQP
jgi:hypothetical protein